MERRIRNGVPFNFKLKKYFVGRSQAVTLPKKLNDQNSNPRLSLQFENIFRFQLQTAIDPQFGRKS